MNINVLIGKTICQSTYFTDKLDRNNIVYLTTLFQEIKAAKKTIIIDYKNFMFSDIYSLVENIINLDAKGHQILILNSGYLLAKAIDILVGKVLFISMKEDILYSNNDFSLLEYNPIMDLFLDLYDKDVEKSLK